MKTQWNERKLEKKKRKEEILSHLQNEQPGFSIIEFFLSTLSLALALSRISFAPMLRHFYFFSHYITPYSPLGSPGDGLPHGFRLRPGPHELRREVGRRGKKRDVVTQEQ